MMPPRPRSRASPLGCICLLIGGALSLVGASHAASGPGAPPADPEDARLVAKLGLQESDKPVREMVKGWKPHAYSANQERSNVAEKKEKPTNIKTVRAFRCSQEIDGSNEEVSVSYDQFVHPNSHESQINKFVAGNASAPGQLSAKHCPDINRSDYMGDDEESWTIKRLCSHVIQIIHHHAYAHGVHPTFQVETYFLDERTGEKLPLERLFLPSGVAKLDQLVKKEFRKNTKEFCEFSFDSLSTHGSVQFTPPDNLEVVFSDMEISSHVCPAVVSMDMKQIRRLIEPKGLLGCLAH